MRLQPGKPFRRIRDECQFSLVRTHDDVGAIRSVFDQGEDGTGTPFRRMHPPGGERLVRLASLLTCRLGSRDGELVLRGGLDERLQRVQPLLIALCPLLEELQRQSSQLLLHQRQLCFQVSQPGEQVRFRLGSGLLWCNRWRGLC